ncbi:probable C-terminal domain small phosphatase [Fagus crenata]
MVSKICKRTPTKCIRDCRSHHRRHRRKSPEKNVGSSSTVLASINKSLFTCQRRLIKLFSKLARLGTPKRHKGFKILKKLSEEEPPEPEPEPEITARRALVFDNNKNLLPPMISPKRTVFLDLDETLIHSKADPPPERFDFVVKPRIEGEVMNFYVLKRPGVDQLLASLAERFEVVVFTAGLKEYASLVLDRLDTNAVISHRLYRDSCKEVDGKFVKDLSDLGRDMRRVVIVDDNPNAYAFQPENAIPIRPFTDDLGDRELGRLVDFFEWSDCFDDMRDAVKQFVVNGDYKIL